VLTEIALVLGGYPAIGKAFLITFIVGAIAVHIVFVVVVIYSLYDLRDDVDYQSGRDASLRERVAKLEQHLVSKKAGRKCSGKD